MEPLLILITSRSVRAKKRIRQTALDLHAEETYPSFEQVKRASKGPTGLDCPEVCAVLHKVKGELGLLKSD